MTPQMEFECLLVSRDPALYCTINKVLRNFSITIDHYLSSSKAADAIVKGTHDLVVLDWDGEGSSEIVRTVWKLQQKKKPTLLAISDDGRSVPGVHIALRKPVSLESGTESVKAAYSRMLLDYRLSARYAVMVPVTVRDETGRSFSVTITDIGDGGVGLMSKDHIEPGSLVFFSMQLPETAIPLHIQARLLWSREHGTAGCEIVSMPPVDRDILRDWLRAKTRVKKPMTHV